MWPTLKLQSKMTTPLNGDGRPWTPPDIDSSYLPDPFGPDPAAEKDSAKPEATTRGARLEDSGYVGHEQDSISQYAPHTDAHPHAHPLRTPDPPVHHGPQYPYTPDSAQKPLQLQESPLQLQNAPLQLQQNSPLYPIPPLPPMPWDKAEALSPVQDALSSCISHLESLIQTRQPTDEQMEYLIAKVEEMTQCLSAPDPQSRQSDDHLFSELEISSALAVDLNEVKPTLAPLDGDVAAEADTAAAYTREVAKYIEDVARYTGYLRQRLEETKQLNSISTEIIDDLRSLLRDQYWQLDEYKNRALIAETKAKQLANNLRQKQRRGFWASVGYALDMVGEMWLEW
ncbi:hypothetical protein DM02DRAFT_650156 [Periconia macrospinosa]|uniref:Uncharacterized protein n=1 Tax=Periconia macrospinosa TaxID=97972 RepID=A0A2V1E684_9PLEO|nr:hypothetical protein DM02DRAFT_650156 [Periconia macrospinosa]